MFKMDSFLSFKIGARAKRYLNSASKSTSSLILGCMFVACSDKLEPISADELTKELTAIVDKSVVPGLGIAIIQNDKVVYKNGFGFQDVSSKTPYTTKTQQPIGSVSKTFIAAALSKAIDLELLTLDTPINDLLPEPIINPHQPNNQVTIRHLVTHSSSFVDFEEAYFSTYYVSSDTHANIDPDSEQGKLYQEFDISITDTPRTLSELVNDYYYPDGALYSEDNFLDAQVGIVSEYSNLASSLTAYLIEIATGMQYEDFLQTYIFNPLMMSSTGFQGDEVTQDQVASLYLDGIALPAYKLESFPDGGLRSTVEDLSIYLLDMMKGQNGQSDTLFSQSAYQTLFTKQNDYSIFWSASDKGGFSHSGSDPGLSTLIGFGPNLGGAMVLTFNVDDGSHGNESVLGELWGDELGLLVARFLSTDQSEI